MSYHHYHAVGLLDRDGIVFSEPMELLHAVDIPSEIFTPTFAISRTAGWTAHVLEQFADNLLIRPESVYVGARGRTFVPVNQRS